MTPALRKAAVLSLVLVTLTIIGAVLLLNEPDRDYGTEPGGPEETSRPEEQAEQPVSVNPYSTQIDPMSQFGKFLLKVTILDEHPLRFAHANLQLAGLRHCGRRVRATAPPGSACVP